MRWPELIRRPVGRRSEPPAHGLRSTVADPAILRRGLDTAERPLDAATRRPFEDALGANFSGVRIHAGRAAAESASAIGADAYSLGGHVILGAGQAIGGTSGRAILAHELSHVAQRLRPSSGQPGAVARPAIHPGGNPVAPAQARLETAAAASATELVGGKLDGGPALQSRAGVGHSPTLGTAPADLVLRQGHDPLDDVEGNDDATIEDMTIDRSSRRVQLRTMGGRLLNGTLTEFSSALGDGEYLLTRNFGPDPQRVWDIARRDGRKVLGGLMFDVDLPDIDFGSLTFRRPFDLHVGSGLLAGIGQRQPLNTTYDEVKNDEAYIDNFTSASYDAFRKEVHLFFPDGTESVIPIGQIERGGPPPIPPKVQAQVDELRKQGQLTPPTSDVGGAKPGEPTFITVRGQDQFFDDPVTGTLRPATLHPGVTPRLHQAIKDLDTDTQDLLFSAADAFKAGVPMPEGSEYIILLPILARGGMGLKQAVARAAEQRAAGSAERSELGGVIRGAEEAAATKGGKAPYASSLGELEEAKIIAGHVPGAKQLPPKAKGADYYTGGTETVVTVTQKSRGKTVTIEETHVSGAELGQIHTVLSADKATVENVSRAVTNKLDKFFDLVHNSQYARPARDPKPIRPNTYRRVVFDGPPAGVVVHIHLREAKVTPQIRAAAETAAKSYPSLGDLPPVRVVVTGQ